MLTVSKVENPTCVRVLVCHVTCIFHVNCVVNVGICIVMPLHYTLLFSDLRHGRIIMYSESSKRKTKTLPKSRSNNKRSLVGKETVFNKSNSELISSFTRVFDE